MVNLTANEARFLIDVSGSQAFDVVSFVGQEEISRPYQFNVTVAVDDENIDFSALIATSAHLSLLEDDEVQRHIHGLICSVEELDFGRRLTTYQLQIVPAISFLSKRVNCRIFQETSTPDIIAEVLDCAGMMSDEYKFVLQGQYGPREYCVQYHESDLNFISRLMEEEGIFYYFEHSKNAHKLVIADDAIVHKTIDLPSEIAYHDLTGLIAERSTITSFHYSQCVKSDAVVLKDFNFKKPALNLQSEQTGDQSRGLEIYDYPGIYSEPERGEQLSKIRLQSLQTFVKVGIGESVCLRLVPGYTFKLINHPRSGLDQEYLIVSVSQSAQQPQVLEEGATSEGESYENRFKCIPLDVIYRPQCITQKPIVQGVQSAIVVGPVGEEIYTDKFGRVKVQFHWDRQGARDEKSSCWIRVSQTWAGANYGSMFIPRIGHEAIVDFVNGDPDRPIIVGRVYHSINVPPYELPAHKTKSVIRSNTSMGGGAANELLMEDKQDETQVVLSNAYGHKITQDEKTQSLSIETRDKHIITLDDQNKKISITTTNGHQFILNDTDSQNEGSVTLMSTMGYQLVLDDKNQKMLAQTKDGHVLILDDENKKIELTTTNGHSVLLDDENEAIGVTSAKGHYLTVDDSEDSITLEDSGGTHRFKIDIGGGKLVISTDSGSIDLEAPSGTIALKATNIEIEAQSDCKLTGLNIKAEAGLEHKVSGTMVTAEASALHTITGSLVKIN